MKGSNKGKGAFIGSFMSAGSEALYRRVSSRSRSQSPASNRRERSRSADLADLAGHEDDRIIFPPPTRPAFGIALPTQMRCRDRTCTNVSFKVYVDDPNRPEETELLCARCGTTTSINPVLRVVQALADASRSRREQ